MRLFTKIFISVISVFSIAFLISGYFILSYSLESSVEREKEFALRQYKYDKFTVQSDIIANESEILNETQDIYKNIAHELPISVCFTKENGEVIYTKGIETDLIKEAELVDNSYWYKVVQDDGESFILIGSIIWQNKINIGFFTKTDITEAISQQKVLQEYFERCFFVALAAGIVLILGLSLFLTSPIKHMTKIADRIANGCYNERLQMKSKDEIGNLAVSFNQMADAVEKTIEELSDEAKKKEDFVANFAHELKTPLTSVIGYADRIYQKDLPREEVKRVALYIWNEGMRLESLSLKLMDLTNLDRQKFLLSFMPARELLYDVVEGIDAVLANKEIDLQCEAEEAYIKADYDLMKTVILNLIDNAAKADCKHIQVCGKKKEKRYQIEVNDDGRGIPQEELSRITEAFYMVDKSRSRKQHSAGIGLALVTKIVEIHNGKFSIQSKEGVGTSVIISLPYEEDGECNE